MDLASTKVPSPHSEEELLPAVAGSRYGRRWHGVSGAIRLHQLRLFSRLPVVDQLADSLAGLGRRRVTTLLRKSAVSEVHDPGLRVVQPVAPFDR